MFMFLKKNKKGFTLIELMVVVAIIGILALLGLRLYTGQQDKAKEAIVKANAGTVQTLIQAALADGPIATAADAIHADVLGANTAGLQNPFGGATIVANSGTADGSVVVTGSDSLFSIQGYGKGGKVLFTPALTAQR